LDSLGLDVSLDRVTDQLESRAVSAFAKSYKEVVGYGRFKDAPAKVTGGERSSGHLAVKGLDIFVDASAEFLDVAS